MCFARRYCAMGTVPIVADRVRGTSGHAHCAGVGCGTDRVLPIALRQGMCGPPRGGNKLLLTPLPLAFPISYAAHGLAAAVSAIPGWCTTGRTLRFEAARSVAKIVQFFLAA
jgi:hypothetical protein